MERIQKSIEVGSALSTVYNQWRQFEEFPRFMEGIKEVRQLDDQRLHWVAEIAGKEKEWTAKITGQIPDHRIAWQSEAGEYTSGAVDFDKNNGHCSLLGHCSRNRRRAHGCAIWVDRLVRYSSWYAGKIDRSFTRGGQYNRRFAFPNLLRGSVAIFLTLRTLNK